MIGPSLGPLICLVLQYIYHTRHLHRWCGTRCTLRNRSLTVVPIAEIDISGHSFTKGRHRLSACGEEVRPGCAESLGAVFGRAQDSMTDQA